ncbi:MAG: ABC transporter ATP-binding protein [Bacillota bacterium]
MWALALFDVENLIYYYPDTERPAINGINLVIEEGEFVLVAGASGSGKSSLARVLAGLIPDFYGGRFGGRVYFQGREMRSIDRRKLARQVGMVFQDPEKQLVMNGVEAEIAFGLENLGLPQKEMFRRVAEVISFLGLTELRREFTAGLSGGQKQKLALAAVLAMQPRVLILDEPTSQLDPVAAEDFFNLVKRLNEEIGFTIVLIEQRLERCFHLADRVVFMEGGRVAGDGSPEQAARWAVKNGGFPVPPVARLFSGLGFPSVPVTVKEGRRQLRTITGGDYAARPSPRKAPALPLPGGPPLLEVKKLWFAYPKGGEVLLDINLRINSGEFVAILGENGAGKSTLLKNMVGLLHPGRGQVLIKGVDLKKSSGRQPGRQVAYLSQNPNDYLFQDTVEDELLFTLKNFGMKDDGIVTGLLDELQLGRYRRVNPRDLSSGERQRVALASVLVTGPDLLVLDEPTRGLDYRLKAGLGSFLAGRAAAGTGVVLVTHDVEFAAEYATRVIMMFAGRIVSDGTPGETLGQSVFYTTQIGKLCRGFCDGILTFEEAVEIIGPLLSGKTMARAGTLK